MKKLTAWIISEIIAYLVWIGFITVPTWLATFVLPVIGITFEFSWSFVLALAAMCEFFYVFLKKF